MGPTEEQRCEDDTILLHWRQKHIDLEAYALSGDSDAPSLFTFLSRLAREGGRYRSVFRIVGMFAPAALVDATMLACRSAR